MLIKSLHLKNILSFRDATLELRPLNVLIGPNASGKSNLIDAVALLRAAPDDVAGFLRRHGPTGAWAWQGPGQDQDETPFREAQIRAELRLPEPVSYDLKALMQDDRLHALSENLNHIKSDGGGIDYLRPVFRSLDGKGTVWPTRADGVVPTRDDGAETIELAADKSVMSAISHPVNYPALTATAQKLAAIRIYRSWHTGRDSAARRPQPTDGAVDFLEEDFSNLALVVNELQGLRLKPSMDEYLQRFYEDYESLHARVYGNTIQLAVNEKGQSGSLPASRLSDGAIRFIALLAILCHPSPPPLVCIEEPEIAMHPDSLWLVKELLLAASERTQIIVTTHSTELVSLFSSDPEAVVVCDRDAAKGTRFRRVSREWLGDWMDDWYIGEVRMEGQRLGEVWMAGALRGVR